MYKDANVTWLRHIRKLFILYAFPLINTQLSISEEMLKDMSFKVDESIIQGGARFSVNSDTKIVLILCW